MSLNEWKMRLKRTMSGRADWALPSSLLCSCFAPLRSASLLSSLLLRSVVSCCVLLCPVWCCVVEGRRSQVLEELSARHGKFMWRPQRASNSCSKMFRTAGSCGGQQVAAFKIRLIHKDKAD